VKITILALGSTGDVTPCAALGGALARAGHRVCLASHQDFEGLAHSQRLEFHAIAPPAKDLVQGAGSSFAAILRRYIALGRQLVDSLTAPQVNQADLILNQLPGGLFGRDMAGRHNIPMLGLVYLPMLPTEAYPAIGWPSLRLPGYNRFTYRVSEALLWFLFARTIKHWRSSLGLPSLSGRAYFQESYPVLAGFSPRLLPPPADWGAEVHVTGYWHPQDPSWQPDASLLAFLERGPAPVYIGFGSMPIPHPEKTLRMVLSALEQTGLRAVLHAGWGGLNGQNLPPGVFPIEYAPFTWLFPRMAGMVIHGGAGAVHCAARSGKPSLVVPFLFDQFSWGNRLHRLQAGPSPLPFRQLSPERLALRLNDLVDSIAYQQGAQALGYAVQQENGLDTALRIVQERYGH
jgi:sterol 3beta-glucosyltransferase